MKNMTRKLKSVTLLVAIFFLLIISAECLIEFDHNSIHKKNNTEIDDVINPRTSVTWQFAPVFIDNTNPSINWDWAKSQPWCSGGSGTFNEPYIIENTIWTVYSTIDVACLGIANSDVHFIVRNCTFHTSGSGDIQGIRMYYVKNGILTNNTFSFIIEEAIGLKHCYNNTISNNTIINCKPGIELWDYCNNNTISENTIYNSGGTGIAIADASESYDNCYNNTISKNLIYNNEGSGINIADAINTIIIGNIITNNQEHGIDVEEGINTTIIGNRINNNQRNGINIQMERGSEDDEDFFNYNMVSENNLTDNGICGIYISVFADIGKISSSSNYIIDNIITNGSYGIAIDLYARADAKVYFNNSVIRGNNITTCKYIGIYQSAYADDNGEVYCNYNNITDNKIVECNAGIYLRDCINTTILNNKMTKCGLILNFDLLRTIEDITSNYIAFSNLVNGNPIHYYINKVNLKEEDFTNPGQIILINCNNSVISNLNISETSDAIEIYYGKNNTFIDNNCSLNNRNGIFLAGCNESKIIENIANNNSIGISLLRSTHNNVSGNIVKNSKLNGLSLDGSTYNTISRNNFTNNNIGVDLSESDYNNITRNMINDSAYCGIRLCKSNYNNASHNKLYRNYYCIRDEYCTGNFYLDNGDCKVTYIRDTPFYIAGDDDDGNGTKEEPPVVLGYNLFALIAGILSSIILISISCKRKKIRQLY